MSVLLLLPEYIQAVYMIVGYQYVSMLILVLILEGGNVFKRIVLLIFMIILLLAFSRKAANGHRKITLGSSFCLKIQKVWLRHTLVIRPNIMRHAQENSKSVLSSYSKINSTPHQLEALVRLTSLD